MTGRVDYVDSGFDRRDGLTNGRWMRSTWGVLEWVQIEPPARTRRKRAAECDGCGIQVESAGQCRRCVNNERRRIKRATERGLAA